MNPRIIITALLMMLTMTYGCAPKNVSLVPLSAQKVIALDAEDVVYLMVQSGFSKDEILQHGTALRNGLALYGATQIRSGDKVKAIFAVLQDDTVHVSSSGRGSFSYNVQKN